MTDVKISQLPFASTPLAGTEIFPLVQAGVTRQTPINSIVAKASTISALRALNPSIAPNIYVTGYYSPGDGGGGEFYSVTGAAPTTYIDNGGSIIVPTGGDGSSAWLRVNTNATTKSFDGVIDVRAFGAKGDGITNDTAAIQAAVDCGSNDVYFSTGTYLIAATAGVGVTISSSITLFGDGDTSIIKSIPTLIGSYYYSNNLFTTIMGLDNLTFDNLTFDGSGTGSGGGGAVSEYSLILTYNVQKLIFSNLTITEYSGSWSGAPQPLYNRLFQAVSVRNNVDTEYTKFFSLNLRDNHYEQIDVYNPEISNSYTVIQNCSEINSLANPDSHTAFQVTGGHYLASNNFFRNTKFSTLNINNVHSAIVSNNVFIDQYPLGFAAAVNFGQSLWFGNNNCTVTGNYFENNDANAISHAGGDNLIISNNTIINGGQTPIKARAIMDPTTFSAVFPEYTIPTLQDSYGVIISGNYILGAKYTAGPTGYGIWLAYAAPSAGKYWRGVEVTDNIVRVNTAPYDTWFSLVLDQVFDALVTSNYFNYTRGAILSQADTNILTIAYNYFISQISTSSTDLIFSGAYASGQLTIKNNVFENIPRLAAYNIASVSGRTFTGITIMDNINTKPTYLISTTSPYYVSNTVPQMVTAAPTTGIYREFDHVATVPAAARPSEYVCSAAGCFATFTSTAAGTAGDSFITVTDGTEFLPGQFINITGMGTAGATISRIVTSISGNTININTAVVTTASGQTVTARNPTFVATANYV